MEHEKKAAFKLGFLLKLAEVGVTPDQFFKRASSILDSAIGGVADVPKSLVSQGISAGRSGLGMLGDALVHGPIYAGSALGAAHATMEAPTDSGIQALQRVEELSTLERLTREIHERRKRHLNG